VLYSLQSSLYKPVIYLQRVPESYISLIHQEIIAANKCQEIIKALVCDSEVIAMHNGLNLRNADFHLSWGP
jgi:hypothetical protein